MNTDASRPATPSPAPELAPELAIGIVGCGKIARDQHIPALAAVPGLRLAAIADPVARHPDLPSHADLTAMLAANPEIRAVAMCQPPQARFAAARAAILAGRHVFLEKPPGATLSEVEALIALAQDRGVTLFTAWHSREASAVAQAKALLAKAAIRAVRINWKEDVRVWHPGQAWIWQPGGFGVFDPGINALSILTAILPEAVRLTGAELAIPANKAAPIAAALAMETESGIPIAAEFDFRQTGPQSWDIHVDTDLGEVALLQGGNILTVAGAPAEAEAEHEYRALYSRFRDLVQAGQSEVDLAPLRLVADAFLTGRITLAEPFVD